MPAIKRLIQLPLTRPSLLGAVLAVVVGVGTFIYLGDDEAGAANPEGAATVSVLVASRDVNARSRLTEDDLQLLEIPATAAHPLALRSLSDATEQFSASYLAAGQQILPHDVSLAVLGGGLAQLVPEGQRAVSVAISAAAAAGGLVSPGDHIDIVAIFSEELRGEAGTSIVTEDVEVLAISQLVVGGDLDGQANPIDPEGNPNAISATVTVAVSLDDAQRIALAESFGELHIFLRHPDDDSEPFAAPVDLESVVRG